MRRGPVPPAPPAGSRSEPALSGTIFVRSKAPPGWLPWAAQRLRTRGTPRPQPGAAGAAGAGGATPPADAPGTAFWPLGRGHWPVVISPPGDPRWPNPGKSPIGKGWGKERPSAPALGRLFARHPGAGVGVLLGPASG